MFETFTIYSALGIAGGLGLSMLLFTRWKLPEKCRRIFRLNDRWKPLVFIFCLGMVFSFALMLLFASVPLHDIAKNVIEGAGIGFNCALLVGIMRPNGVRRRNNDEAPQGRNKRQYEDNRGRRSRG